jgi:hypothetical protein
VEEKGLIRRKVRKAIDSCNQTSLVNSFQDEQVLLLPGNNNIRMSQAETSKLAMKKSNVQHRVS